MDMLRRLISRRIIIIIIIIIIKRTDGWMDTPPAVKSRSSISATKMILRRNFGNSKMFLILKLNTKLR